MPAMHTSESTHVSSAENNDGKDSKVSAMQQALDELLNPKTPEMDPKEVTK